MTLKETNYQCDDCGTYFTKGTHACIDIRPCPLDMLTVRFPCTYDLCLNCSSDFLKYIEYYQAHMRRKYEDKIKKEAAI